MSCKSIIAMLLPLGLLIPGITVGLGAVPDLRPQQLQIASDDYRLRIDRA
jgi:hypothetical protein